MMYSYAYVKLLQIILKNIKINGSDDLTVE